MKITIRALVRRPVEEITYCCAPSSIIFRRIFDLTLTAEILESLLTRGGIQIPNRCYLNLSRDHRGQICGIQIVDGELELKMLGHLNDSNQTTLDEMLGDGWKPVLTQGDASRLGINYNIPWPVKSPPSVWETD